MTKTEERTIQGMILVISEMSAQLSALATAVKELHSVLSQVRLVAIAADSDPVDGEDSAAYDDPDRTTGGNDTEPRTDIPTRTFWPSGGPGGTVLDQDGPAADTDKAASPQEERPGN